MNSTARTALTDLLKAEYHESLKDLFIKYPFVKSAHFTAYTPYFNDGEECTYSCHHDYCGFNGYDGYGDKDSSVRNAFELDESGVGILKNSKDTMHVEVPNPEYNANNNSWTNRPTKWVNIPNPNYNPLYAEAVKAFRDAFDGLNDEQWKDLVGDHCSVLIDEHGIHTAEYGHD